MTRLVAWSDRLVRAAAVALLLALLASVVLGVISRQLNQPLSWTDELAQYLLVWTGFAGWMIASRSHGHIRILAFAGMVKGTPRLILEVATQAAVVLFGAALIWLSFNLIQRNLDVESISLPFPSAMLYAPLPFLGLTLVLQALTDAAEAIHGHINASEGRLL